MISRVPPHSAESQLLEVRLESGTFVVSDHEKGLFAQAKSLDKAYEQLMELKGADQKRDDGDPPGWGFPVTQIQSLGDSVRAWLKRQPSDPVHAWLNRQQWMGSLLALGLKTAFVSAIGVIVITLVILAEIAILRPQIKAALKATIGPAALAQRLSTMDPAAREIYLDKLRIIVHSLIPFAESLKPLVAAATPTSPPVAAAKDGTPGKEFSGKPNKPTNPRTGPTPIGPGQPATSKSKPD